MIGLGPHTMTTGLWIFVAALQVGLIALAFFAVWLAAGRPRLTRRRTPRSQLPAACRLVGGKR